MIQLKLVVLLSVFLAILARVSAVALPEANSRRCGVENGDLDRIKRYTLLHGGHKSKTITYNISDYSKNHTHEEIDDCIKRAFNAWTEHTNLKFIQKQPGETVDINIRFVVGAHGTCEAFDGPGNVLAHANLPFVHFDDEENWKTTNKGEGTSLYKVAVHEIGHALGLNHSPTMAAVMFAGHYSDDEDQFRLDDDDIKGIQDIYGEKKVLPPYNEDLCKDPTFDTMFNTPDGKTYILKKNNYYELQGTRVRDGPKPIADKWKGLPDSIGAAFSQNGKTFFFKEGQYWRFTGYEMDQNYPDRLNKPYSEIPDNFNDATVWKDGKVYFFAGSKVYRMDEFHERYTNVTKKDYSEDWDGIPKNIDAVHYWEDFGSTFFFKDDNFYSFETSPDGQKPYAIPTTSYFFGCRSHE